MSKIEGENKKVIVIAEIGVNHNGNISLAKKLIDKASESGADIAKFQSFKPQNLLTGYAKKANYQLNNSSEDESQFEMLKRLELSREDHLILIEYCKKKEIEFLSSPFNAEDLLFLDSLGVRRIKIPSGEITNPILLKEAGSLNKQVILSTGMSNMKEVEIAFSLIVSGGITPKDITILHCNTEYPTPYEDVNLKAMLSIKNLLDVDVGYSDHTLGIEVPIAAVALGATVIEKHLTLDRAMDGPDHKSSLEPKEFLEMTRCIRNIEDALGKKEKKPSESELKNIQIARKSIVALRSIKKGEAFSLENICFKRPGTGISPMEYESLLGTKAKRIFEEDDLIEV